MFRTGAVTDIPQCLGIFVIFRGTLMEYSKGIVGAKYEFLLGHSWGLGHSRSKMHSMGRVWVRVNMVNIIITNMLIYL